MLLRKQCLACARLHLLTCTQQGAQIMSKFGINVPPGMPVFSLDDVPKAAEAMKDENEEVRLLTACSVPLQYYCTPSACNASTGVDADIATCGATSAQQQSP
jgi:hypothetical protein